MTLVISLTQFVFLALGLLALNILARVTSPPAHPTPLWLAVGFLVNYGYWLVILPILWSVIALIAGQISGGKAMQNVIQSLGVAIAAAIFLVFGAIIFFYSN